MRAFFSIVLVLGVVVIGCDNGGTDGGHAEDTVTAEDEQGGCILQDLTGRAYRVTVLESQEPTDALNPTFAQDIATYVNVLVFHIVEHNLEEGYIMMTAGPCSTEFEDPDAAELVVAAFRYALPVEPFRVDLSGCDFEIKEAAVLDMMFKTLNKPYRIDRLFGNGKIREDQTGIDEGYLAGGILLDTAIDLCTTIPGFGVVNFHWFMNLAHICPNFDTDDDGEMDAYFFSGSFTAEDVTDLFVPGEIVPIDSVVEVCKPHTEECIPIER